MLAALADDIMSITHRCLRNFFVLSVEDLVYRCFCLYYAVRKGVQQVVDWLQEAESDEDSDEEEESEEEDE